MVIQREAKEVMNEYLLYLEEQQFKIVETKVLDSREWVKSAIKNNEIDFIIREGHGNREFSFSTEGTLIKATKGKNPQQVVYLFLPTSGARKAREVSWDEMGDLMKSRDGQGALAPLYYVDTKCYSSEGVCTTQGMIRNPYFIQIASKGTATTFVNDSTSALRAMLDGFLKMKNFDGIKTGIEKALKGDPDRENHVDNYIFPNSHNYKFGPSVPRITIVPLEKK
jgi:hypothetical protein